MRYILESDFSSGAWNMAVDSAIVDAVASAQQPPTLRLYGWHPFCLSLGYGQRARDVDAGALAARGWDLVRRPSGGKAILHGDELTYSLCLPLDHALALGDVVASYRRISRGLLGALDRLGLAATAGHQGDATSGAGDGPVCFVMPSHYEIKVDGRKLIGSAQLRRKGVLLQHGSLPLTGDLGRICHGLAFECEAARQAQRQSVRQRAITLEQASGQARTWHDVADAFLHGFSQSLDLSLAPGQLSQREFASANAYQRERYASSAWTLKR